MTTTTDDCDEAMRDALRVHKVTLWLCDDCLDGAGGECHSAGCTLWINRAPDLSIRHHPMVERIGKETTKQALARRLVRNEVATQRSSVHRRVDAWLDQVYA